MVAFATAFLLGLAAASPTPTPLQASKVIVLVRHAEKTKGDDPPLSKAGTARAVRLSEHLKALGVSSIITTEYQRTQLTAAPLAKALKIVPLVLSGNDSKMVADRAREGSGATLVVGHSNTLPEILTALGVEPTVSIADDEYENLLLVVLPPGDGARPVLVTLHY